VIDLDEGLNWLPAFALDRISEFVIVTDAALDEPVGPRIIFVNRAIMDATGYDEEELVGTSPRIFQGKETDPATLARVRAALSNGETVQESVLNYRKDGSTYWTELNIAPVRAPTGEVAFFLSVQRDVTDTRKASAARELDLRLFAAGEKIGDLGTWGFDLEAGRVLWSEGTFEIFDWDRDRPPPDLEGGLDLVHPDDRDAMATLLRQCVKDQVPYEREISGYTTKGVPLRLAVRGEALRGENGQTKAVVGAIRDITSERRIEEALSETISHNRIIERHFASARQAAKIGVFDYSVDEDLQHWSDELFEMTGMTARIFPAPAREFIDRVDDADRARFMELFERAVELGEDYTITVRFHRPDGRMMHMQIIAEVRDGETGRRIVGIARDVTEEHEASNRLRRQEERFRIIADTVSDVLWDYEIEENDFWVSPDWPQKLGLSFTAIHFDPPSWTDYICEGDRKKSGESLADAIKSTSDRWQCEFRVVDADGSLVDVEVRASILRRDDGRAYRILGNLRNVTDENRRREGFTRSRALETVGKMTGGIAHDFNNLLVIIQGNAELLEMSELDEEDAESVRLIAKASQAAASLTARLLSFSGQMHFSLACVDVGEMIGDLVPLLKSALTEAVALETHVAPDLAQLEVDAAALEQVIINLAVNARDAMKSGGTVRITCENYRAVPEKSDAYGELEPGDYVRITVADDGEGMSEEVIEKAFEPFFTTKDVGKGTGLGLSTVYGFARQSGGAILIDSELGKGSRVSLYLPVSEACRLKNSEALNETVPTGIAGQRVLVVEDQHDVREHVCKLLTRAGFAVSSASDAATALGLLESGETFDLLFTDVLMPGGMNGVELAEAASAIAPEMKVLYTSGFPASAFDEVGVDPGHNLSLLKKPYRAAELVEAIGRVAAGDHWDPV
jgi:PAS domain S-box-containing protein